jgi:hypothetical protein
MRTNKQYFAYYIKDNILIFDVFDYIEELAADAVDYFNEWGLIKDDYVSLKCTVFKEFVQQRLNFDTKALFSKAKFLNCKVLCFYKKKKTYNQWAIFFKEPEKVINLSKKILKKNLPNFIETEPETTLFQSISGSFNNLPVVIPSGEDEEFVQTKLKKL